MPPQLLGVPPYYNASAIIGGSAANRVTPHLLGVPPRTLFAAEWCMVRATAKQNILGGGERHSPIITLLPPPPILSPARDTAPFRAILLCKIARNPQDYPTLAKTAEPPSLTHDQSHLSYYPTQPNHHSAATGGGTPINNCRTLRGGTPITHPRSKLKRQKHHKKGPPQRDDPVYQVRTNTHPL